MIELKIYRAATGEEPFTKWLKVMKSSTAKSRIFKALSKMEVGLLSDVSPVGEGVQELRLHFECGYRIYFGNDGAELIVLLAGSDKSDQRSEIKNAKKYWQDYKRQKAAERQKKGADI